LPLLAHAPPTSPLFPYTTLFRSAHRVSAASSRSTLLTTSFLNPDNTLSTVVMNPTDKEIAYNFYVGSDSAQLSIPAHAIQTLVQDRKSTRLNSSHVKISYAVFCL